MKLFTKKDKRTELEKEIESVLIYMGELMPDSDEHKRCSETLERLYKAKASETPKRISPDTKAVIAGNLLGIGLILTYERLNVISTKALGFVLRSRM